MGAVKAYGEFGKGLEEFVLSWNLSKKWCTSAANFQVIENKHGQCIIHNLDVEDKFLSVLSCILQNFRIFQVHAKDLFPVLCATGYHPAIWMHATLWLCISFKISIIC